MYTDWQETYFQFGRAKSILMGFGKKCPTEFFIWIFAWQGLLEWYSHTFTKGVMSFHYLVIRHLAVNTSKIISTFILNRLPALHIRENKIRSVQQTIDYILLWQCAEMGHQNINHRLSPHFPCYIVSLKNPDGYLLVLAMDSWGNTAIISCAYSFHYDYIVSSRWIICNFNQLHLRP